MDKSAKIINIDNNFDKAVSEAVKCYNTGEVFIYPTDTVYGFGCNPLDDDSIEKLNVIKQRDQSKQFILLIDSISTLSNYIFLPGKIKEDFLENLWPNPISIIFKLNDEKRAMLDMETAAFRIPDHKFCCRFLEEIKSPLVSTSVNRKDGPPMNDHSLIINEFSGEVSAVFYQNYEGKNEPSTLVDLTGEKPVILRQGSTKFVELFEKLQ